MAMINDIFHSGRPSEVFYVSPEICVCGNMNDTRMWEHEVRNNSFGISCPNIYRVKDSRWGLCKFFTSPDPIYPGNTGKITVLQGEFSLCRKSIAPDHVFLYSGVWSNVFSV